MEADRIFECNFGFACCALSVIMISYLITNYIYRNNKNYSANNRPIIPMKAPGATHRAFFVLRRKRTEAGDDMTIQPSAAQPPSAVPAAPSVIRMNRVGKRFETGLAAVDNVDMHIREGELVSFVGPSGCGKSTLFRLIAGLSRPSEGAIEIVGEEPDQARRRNTISYVFQDATLLPWSNVWENIVLPLKLRRVPKRILKDEAARALELVGLQDYAKALPRQLSGGMKMRVSIARALITHPKLLLMDEPFGALDEMTRQSLQNELLDIWRKSPGMTILFVTHNMFEAVFLSTRIAVMTPRPGRISRWVDVPVPYPRDERFRTTSDFSGYVERVSNALHGGHRTRGAWE